jgi:hypothetical protein
MIRSNMPPPPGGRAFPSAPGAQPGQSLRRALLAAVLVIAGSAVTGVAGGLIWAAVAPRVQYQVYSLRPQPIAYATNPETSAFIAADGWYCFIALAGGALIGLIAYLFAIRRYGPVPMVGAVLGATAAAFLAAWLGHEASGGLGFDHLLATSKPGSYLYAPISLGSHGAVAFWPLAAAVVAGGIELTGVLRARRQPPSGAVPMPGMESFGMRPYPGPQDREDGTGDLGVPGLRGEDGRDARAPAARPSPEDDRHPGLPHRAQNGSARSDSARPESPGSQSPGSQSPGSQSPGSQSPGSEPHGAADGPGGRGGAAGAPPR